MPKPKKSEVKNKIPADQNDLIFNDFWNMQGQIDQEEPQMDDIVGGVRRRKTECLELSQKYLYRRAFSEVSLLDSMRDMDFKENHSYNFITAGDVDALSYLKLIINKQDLKHVLISTWVISAEDILQIGLWHEEGKLQSIDFYVGEIFPNQYKIEYDMLKNLTQKTGKLVHFKNHSKIFAGYGDKFYFGIQTSANVNTNPRTENGNIIIGKEIYDFYLSYFDKVTSFK
jgi:hypothetical protein